MELQHLLSWRDSSAELWRRCLDDTLRFADGLAVEKMDKHIGLLFMDPSLRTRASMEVAAGRLGCRVTTLAGQDAWQIEWDDGVVMNGQSAEHVREAAAVLSGYFDLLGVRSFAPLANPGDELSDTPISRLARHCTVPVVNLESSAFHPCQALADAAVLSQHLNGDFSGSRFVLSWAYHPRALPLAVPQSTLLMAARLGTNVTLTCPPGFLLPDRIMAEAALLARQHGGSVDINHDLTAAARGAQVIYAKSWTPHELATTPDGGAAVRDRYKDWRITDDLMRTTDRGAFMHCLPVRRNVVVDDAVLDGPSSLVARQARMRVDANAAIITSLLGGAR
jgi:N-acetylornithine carbamoyltransferase